MNLCGVFDEWRFEWREFECYHIPIIDVETPVSGPELGFDSFNSGSHVATRSLSPMTAHQQQWLSLADSNLRAPKQCSLFT
jgi:hypothetical protein